MNFYLLIRIPYAIASSLILKDYYYIDEFEQKKFSKRCIFCCLYENILFASFFKREKENEERRKQGRRIFVGQC